MLMTKEEIILNEYRDCVSTNPVMARNLIRRLDYKNNYYLLQCIAQTYLDESRFKNGSDVMRKRFVWRKWKMAEKYIIASFTLNSENAEVLYTMGEVRKLNYQDDIAIYCFEEIIKMRPREIAQDKYSRGIDFARELINDAKFELYRLNHDNEHMNLSMQYLSMYKNGLKKGITTIFTPIERFLLD
jgi:hypothetical protein